MLFYIFTTGKCNLKCRYCGGSFPENLVPWRTRYRVEDLARFLEEDEDLTIAFYGGEPLLNVEFIKKLMEKIDAKHWVIQTNGLLIKKLEEKYWRKFDAILLSIDGVREVTDYYRGIGVYDKVLEAARYLKSISVEADLIARMTVSEQTRLYRDVVHLLSLDIFDHVHWQLDVIWSDRWIDFDSWLEKSYLPDLKKLVNLWATKLREGTVLGIAPFLGIIKAMFFEDLPAPPCGSGVEAFAIKTDGTILACPIAVDVEWAKIGDIKNTGLENLRRLFKIEEPCSNCNVFKYCRGRCLYTYYERLWGEEGFRKICRATRYLISLIGRLRDEIASLINEEKIDVKKLNYPKFLNTIEIIP
ncbi:MAG: putative peptide-modifying radical SAM/SPASM domain-containing protein [Thermoprotei archaeon]|nr:MAG: putative peptide-modifying radical SAM/SPASM domain-containing protein [Thermoprotei archaeon]